MVILGLLLLAAAVALTIGIFVSNMHTISVAAFGVSVNHVSVSWLFVVGVITGLVALFGLVLILGGLRRTTRRAHARRVERKDKQNRERELQAENQRLAAQLEEQRAAGAATAPAAMPTAADDRATVRGNAEPRTETVRRTATATRPDDGHVVERRVTDRQVREGSLTDGHEPDGRPMSDGAPMEAAPGRHEAEAVSSSRQTRGR